MELNLTHPTRAKGKHHREDTPCVVPEQQAPLWHDASTQHRAERRRQHNRQMKQQK